MRINGADKRLLKSQIKSMVVFDPKASQVDIARRFNVSRVTAKRWLEEIRNEQIQKIEIETRRVELWRLEEKGNHYIMVLEFLRTDLNHLWDKFPHVLLGVIKSQWQIEKEIYQLKLDLYSRELTEEEKQKIQSIDQRIGIATVVNVNG